MDRYYKRFKDDKLILRDELAIDRTALANERTLLAYLRGGVSLLLAGATFIHFAQRGWFMALGILCLPVGFAVMINGWVRFRSINKAIRIIRSKELYGNRQKKLDR